MSAGYTPLPEDRTAVRWGAALGAVAVGVVIGAIGFGYIYLWANAETWPAPGHEALDPVWPLVSAVLVLVALAANMVGARGDGAVLRLGLVVATVAGAASLVVLTLVIGDADLRPTSHAYGSIATLLLGSQWVVVAAATGGSLLALLRVVIGAPAEWLTSARLATDVTWILAVFVVVVVAATVLLVPHVAPR